ncbi:transcriptional coactivator p15/PC4 family protein [Paraburkholderia sp. MM6662-R1]|uniref:transcriptional coactivator p15/PC4 family protein n=1 Tax=Paraburkholderia sp. MM6662-R1 TaxID=2991066 RepID=UPI003D210968
MSASDLPVLDLQKNARERLRIMHSTYKGKPYIDLRIWYADQNGDYQPSRSGVSIRPEQLAEVVRGLTLAGRELPQGGN